MKLVTVDIRKPLYGNYVYLRKEIIDRAISAGAMMEVVIPSGRAIVDPVKWKAEGKIMKKVFRFKNNPMILYGNWVNVPSSKGKIIDKSELKTENKQPTLF